AMALSVNTYFVQMEQDMGLCPVKQMLDKLNITSTASGAKLEVVPSITLGTKEMSPLTMANVYATFAARGKHCTPIAINKITTVDGKDVKVPQTACTQAFSEQTADALNTVLLNVTEKGTGATLGLEDGRQIAGKTGTTDKKKAAWFSGYTPQLATAVWIGGPTGGVEMKNMKIGDTYYGADGVFGATGPGPIWKMAMDGALKGSPKETFQTIDIPDPAPKPDPNATPGATPPAAPAPGADPNAGGNPPPPAAGNPGAPGTNAGGLIGGGFTFPPGVIGGNGGDGGNGGNGRGHH
ncbi:penicillin-binding transpeptidase domain-containing protein, partial [Streptomyces sp. NRRL S-495]|uniref:penicillin-binding transpeptidase domain-containing protein n=1 Tax=Streptomyces sp. NRRL S-495 TaxID=1609133 RepID=UPI0005F94E82